MVLRTKELVAASMLGAVAFVCEVIPGPPFDIYFWLYPKISWDLTGIPVMISLLLYGPLSAVYTAVVGCAIIFLRGNLAGGIFKVVAEFATFLTYAYVGRGVLIKSASAAVARVLVMTVTNYYLLQFFYKMPTGAVIGLLPALAVFNASQALINILPAKIISDRLKPLVQR